MLSDRPKGLPRPVQPRCDDRLGSSCPTLPDLCMQTVCLIRFDEACPPYFVSDIKVKIRDLMPVRPPTTVSIREAGDREPPTPLGCAVLKTRFLTARKAFERVPDSLKVAYVKKTQKGIIEARLYARECRVWEAGVLAALKKRRAEEIHSRLFSLGWCDELKALGMYKFHRHPLVDIPEEISAQGWAEVQPGLEVFLLNMREEAAARHQEELKRLEKQRLKEAKAATGKHNTGRRARRRATMSG
ncbi:hypothetical protein B0H11DRAFT_2222720 [Mycena galericulata]|nr:hypothetical protein B0H11DRAFT_2222720 [Mycena galericulata]